MGHNQHARAAIGQTFDRGDRGADPAVIGDGRTVQGHVHIAAEQNGFAPEFAEVVDGFHGVQEPAMVTTSFRRLEKPHTLSYQATPSTWSPLTLVRPESKRHAAGSVTISVDTSGASLSVTIFFIGTSAASRM